MITKQIAMNARRGQIFHHVTLKNADKSPVRCRVNGKCKTWVKSPEKFRLPVKHGLKNCFYIDQADGDCWNVA